MAVVAQNDGHSAISLKGKKDDSIREVRHVIKSPSRVGHSGLISPSTFDCYKPQLYILYLYGGTTNRGPNFGWMSERWSCGCFPLGTNWWHARHWEREKETEEKATIKNEPSCRLSQPLVYIYVWRYTYKRTRFPQDGRRSINSFARSGETILKWWKRKKEKLFPKRCSKFYFGWIGEPSELYPIKTLLVRLLSWVAQIFRLCLNISWISPTLEKIVSFTFRLI